MRPTPLRLTVGPLMSNSYLLCDGPECLLVDPGGDPEALLSAVGRRRLRAVIATHMHFDHVWGARRIVDATGAAFMVHRADWEIAGDLLSLAEELGFSAPEIPRSAEFLEDGQVLWRGLRVIHAPGHTPGSLCLMGDGFLLTGDTLFAGSVGRADIPWSDPDALLRSVCRIYREVPHHYAILPGHGPPSTVGAEAEHNPVISARACGDRSSSAIL